MSVGSILFFPAWLTHLSARSTDRRTRSDESGCKRRKAGPGSSCSGRRTPEVEFLRWFPAGEQDGKGKAIKGTTVAALLTPAPPKRLSELVRMRGGGDKARSRLACP